MGRVFAHDGVGSIKNRESSNRPRSPGTAATTTTKAFWNMEFCMLSSSPLRVRVDGKSPRQRGWPGKGRSTAAGRFRPDHSSKHLSDFQNRPDRSAISPITAYTLPSVSWLAFSMRILVTLPSRYRNTMSCASSQSFAMSSNAVCRKRNQSSSMPSRRIALRKLRNAPAP